MHHAGTASSNTLLPLDSAFPLDAAKSSASVTNDWQALLPISALIEGPPSPAFSNQKSKLLVHLHICRYDDSAFGGVFEFIGP